MTEVAAHEILVTSDSDVEVAPHYLQEVVAPLLDPKVGMVTCLYRGKNAAGFWSGLTAIGMSVEMTAGVLVANLLEGMKFGLGPTIAVRKDAVASIGGYDGAGRLFRQRLCDRQLDRQGRLQRGALRSRHRSCSAANELPPHVGAPGALGKATALFAAQRPPGDRPGFRHAIRDPRVAGCGGDGPSAMGALLVGLALVNRWSKPGWWDGEWCAIRGRAAIPGCIRCAMSWGSCLARANYLSRRAVWRDNRYELLPGGRVVQRQSSAESSRKE